MAISVWSGLTEFLIPSPSGAPDGYVIETLSGQYVLNSPSSSGFVTSVSNANGTLTISPTTGAVVASLNLANANTFTALQQSILITTQGKWGYDASNYFTASVASNGAVTFDAVGAGALFTFSDGVTVSGILTATSIIDSGLTSGRVTFAGGGGALTDSANMTFSSPTLSLGSSSSATGILKLLQSGGVQSISITSPNSVGSGFTITLPTSVTSNGYYFNTSGGAMSVVSTIAQSNGGTNATSYGANRVIFQNSGNTAFSSDASFIFATPKLTLVAATTSGASLTIPAGTAPTSPVAGDLWTDTTQKVLYTFQAGIKQTSVGCIFSQTADKSVTNTTTETSIVGTGTGTLTLPANFFVIGKTVRITMSGVYSTVAITGDTVTVKIKYGTTVLASKATTALVTGGSNLYWESEILITCRTTGATGTVQVSGGVRYQIAGSAIVEDELNNSAGTTTLDTTASSLLDVTVTHSAADASNTVKSLVSSFEVLN